ncbi:MAG: hypothetical protein K9J24_16030 [Bacteroidales bacterium]|nr:hypothetical protein [Bacteroidales bacterium]
MPYKITWETKGVYIKWVGKATREENLEANGKIYGDKRYDSLHYQISDILESDTRELTDRDVKVVACLESRAAIWNKHLLVAHLTRDPKLIDQIRMYEKIMADSNWKFGVFGTLEEAREWIRHELNKKTF